MRRLLLPLFVLMTFACLAPAAGAAIVASESPTVLTLASNDSGTINETYTLRDEGAGVFVKISPGPTNDPDGGGFDCALSAADEVVCSRAAISSVHIVAGQGVDTINDNRTQGPSVLEGGSGNDQITTTAGAAAELLGQAGGDKLTSASGDDTLDGGAEADTLTAVGGKALGSSDSGGPGNDTFIGNPDLADRLPAEAGADTYSLGTHVATVGESGDPATLQLDAYPDSVSYDAATNPVVVSLDGLANDGLSGEQDNVGPDVEEVFGGSAGDLLQAGPNAVGLFGLDGVDQLLGGPGPDQLSGGAGSDVLRGGDGDDQLEDGDFTPGVTSSPLPPGGNDVLDGGNGDDSLQSDRGADDISGGPGIDRTAFSRPIPQAPSVPTPVAPAGFTVSLDDMANDGQTGSGEGDNVHSDVEIVESSDGDDVISGSGAADEISTGAGRDVVDPGGGPDVVDLGPGDDRIEAVDQTTDVIRCRAGTDTADVDLPGVRGRPGDQLSDCESVTGTPIPEVGDGKPPAGDSSGPTGPAGDKTRPVVTVSIRTIKSEALLDDWLLDVTVSCNESCTASAKAYKAPAKGSRAPESPIGTGKLKLGTGKRTLHITVAKKSRARLSSKLRTKAQKRHGLKLRVVLAVKDAAGNVTNASRDLTVKG
jgi:Ca2+-binding RTX toxin-like protein